MTPLLARTIGAARRWVTRRTLVVGAILAAGFGLFLLYAFPGYMSSDSITQLVEGRNGNRGDWHPPAMAALWGLVDRVVAGPAGMLILQGATFLAGCYRILRKDLPPPAAAIAASALLVFPPVLAPMAVIWKDCQMAGLLALGISLVDDPRRARWLAGVGLLAVASAMRDNAPVATLAIFLFVFAPARARRWRARIAIGVVAWVATLALAMTTNKLLTQVEQHAWHTSLGPSDIIGIIKQRSLDYSDGELRELLEGTPLIATDDLRKHAARIYSTRSWWYYMVGEDRMFDWPVNDEQRAAIKRAWKTLVSDRPRAYAFHRLAVFRELIGLSGQPVFDPVWAACISIADDGTVSETPPRASQAAIRDAMLWLARKTPLFRPWIYLLLAFALVPLAWRRHVVPLLASGILYELTLLPFAPSPDYRYSHWLVICTLLAAIRIAASWVARRRDKSNLPGYPAPPPQSKVRE